MFKRSVYTSQKTLRPNYRDRSDDDLRVNHGYLYRKLNETHQLVYSREISDSWVMTMKSAVLQGTMSCILVYRN